MIIHTNGIDLFYKKTGQGEPMILLHGNGEDHRIFDAITEKLKRHFTVYAIDSRNHGQSSQTGVYAYATMTEDIYSFIQTLKLGKTRIVGFSDGAIVSLLLSMTHGEVIHSMALLGVNLKPEDFTEESCRFVRQTYEETRDPLFKMMLEQPSIELDELKTVPTPTLVVGAEHDIYRPSLFDEIAQTLPNAALVIMQGHEHDSYIVNQDLLYPALSRFFNVENKSNTV